MRVVVQRVKQASVISEGQCLGKINRGLLLFLGVGREDNHAIVDQYIDKLLKLRIFEDQDGKTNQSVYEIQGEFLVISQFTLYADVRKGRRPSFTLAAPPEQANELYQYFLDKLRMCYGKVESGSFGAKMEVSLVNDGPFTLVLEDEAVLKTK